MTKSLFFILLSFHTLCCMGGNTITTAKQPTLDDLDKVISASKEYTKKYEQEVGILKSKYVHAKSAQDKLSASRELFTKYKSFKLDSAYVYAERKLHYARILHNYEDSVYSELDIADIFNKTGIYVESYKILSGLEHKPMSADMRRYYFSLYGNLYEGLRETSITAYQRTENERRRIMFRDSLKNMKDKQSDWDKAEFLCSQNKYTDALHCLFNSFKNLSYEDRDMGYVAFSISDIYRQINETDKEKQYLIISAIADLKNNVKEYISLRRLATLLYEEGDVKRAYRYMRKSMEDATFCNARLRIIEISDALPIIDKAYESMLKTEQKNILYGFSLVSILVVMLCFMMYFTRKQLKKIAQARRALETSNKSLNDMNLQLNSLNSQLSLANGKLNETNATLQDTNLSLFESNKIKNIYIMEFMNKCSAYIDKLEDYRRSLNKLAVAGKIQELYKQLKSNALVEQEIEEFFEDFDRIFLKIFPNFVISFNGLMKQEELIEPKKPGRLNTELRIYALMRLGIGENEKIASFLRCSRQTVYSYRSRIRLRSLFPDDFEERVVKID